MLHKRLMFPIFYSFLILKRHSSKQDDMTAWQISAKACHLRRTWDSLFAAYRFHPMLSGFRRKHSHHRNPALREKEMIFRRIMALACRYVAFLEYFQSYSGNPLGEVIFYIYLKISLNRNLLTVFLCTLLAQRKKAG